MAEFDNNEQREDIFSKAVRAGKRTYFFDVRATKGNDYYLTITESKKRFGGNPGSKPLFEKHKIFLYKEDFEKFIEGLHESIGEIRKVQPIETERVSFSNYSEDNYSNTSSDGSANPTQPDAGDSAFTNIDFDDLK